MNLQEFKKMYPANKKCPKIFIESVKTVLFNKLRLVPVPDKERDELGVFSINSSCFRFGFEKGRGT